MREIYELTGQAGLTLRLARLKPSVRELLARDGILGRIGEENIHGNVDHAVKAQIAAKEIAMRTRDQPALGWTVVLRRQPVRIVEARPERGYTDMFELICCDCGDHPDLDYRDISPELQQVRGPYLIATGVAAYDEHLKLNHGGSQFTSPGGCG